MLITRIFWAVYVAGSIGVILQQPTNWNDSMKGIIKEKLDTSKLLLKNSTIVISREQRTWFTSYAPYKVECPKGPILREANNLAGYQEKQYLRKRNKVANENLKEYFRRGRIPGFDTEEFLKTVHDISIAFAFSGGGYRSMLTGAGILAAFDRRTPNSTELNKFGGLLQSASYIGGTSGGAWLVMNNLASDFSPMIKAIDEYGSSWDMTEQLLEGVPNFNLETMNTPQDSEPNLASNARQSTSAAGKTMMKTDESNEPGNVPSSSTKKNGWFLRSMSYLFNFSSHIGMLSTTKPKENPSAPSPEAPGSGLGILERILKPIFSTRKSTTEESEDKVYTWKRTLKFYKDIHFEVRAKKWAGFPISLTDYWGRALSRRIFPRTIRTPGVTITSATLLPSFKSHQQPFPIINAIETIPELQFTSETSHAFEINPFEFGSWDSYLNSFVNIKYLGSGVLNGAPTTKDSCVSGFDNLGFLTGTSSSLFNYIFVFLFDNFIDTRSNTQSALQNILKSFGLKSNSKSWQDPRQHPDYVLISPNPFYEKTVKGTKQISKKDHIYLTDGGADGQNVPFHPFLQYSRKVDVIFAYDMSGDLRNFPNGTTLTKTSQRYQSIWVKTPRFIVPTRDKREQLRKNVTFPRYKSVFPKVPTCEEYMRQKYNQRPMFLGCDLYEDYPTKATADDNEDDRRSIPTGYLPPVIVYSPNTHHSFASNTSTFQLSYTHDEVAGMFTNGYNIATYKNGTIDGMYATCVNCAILKREFDRRALAGNFSIPAVCRECFHKYCYKD